MNMPHDLRKIGIVVFDGCQIVDATGPAAVFGDANVQLKAMGRAPGYDVRLIAPKAGPVRTNCGVSLMADHALSAKRITCETLICAGGSGVHDFITETACINSVRRLAARAVRIVSVCTGTFVLAETGLLDGRRAVTHWAHCEHLAKAYPSIDVDPDPIFVRDGNIYTSAGVTAGMDLALALVEADHGRDIALAVARSLVMYVKRPGNQAQFSKHLAVQMAPAGSIRDVQMWLLDNLSRNISVDQMADRAAMSLRTFNRQFKQETGMTPARYVTECRVDTARRLLEESPLAIKTIAAKSGFGDEERMRRAFRKYLGVSADGYRNLFSNTQDAA